MQGELLSYYKAIEQASADMLAAARLGDWDQVVKLEGACVLLISQLKEASQAKPLDAETARAKSRILQRIVVNEGELRNLTEPWLPELERMMAGKPRILH
ncbi:MAG: flagellar protein FliT [Rubrivivax sp.]|nr:flagellar protein FliT [Rubrivivax sp.]